MDLFDDEENILAGLDDFEAQFDEPVVQNPYQPPPQSQRPVQRRPQPVVDPAILDIDQRLEQAEYYKVLMSSPLFGDVANPAIATRVEKEVKDFLRRQLISVFNTGEPPADFSQIEIKALKALAATLLKRPKLAKALGDVAVKPAVPKPPQAARPSVFPRKNAVAQRPAPAPQPEPQEEEFEPEQEAEPAPAPAPKPVPKRSKKGGGTPVPMPTGAAMEGILAANAANTVAIQNASGHNKAGFINGNGGLSR